VPLEDIGGVDMIAGMEWAAFKHLKRGYLGFEINSNPALKMVNMLAGVPSRGWRCI